MVPTSATATSNLFTHNTPPFIYFSERTAQIPMVLIRLADRFVGLIVTIISVICELAFLLAALTLLKYFNCRRLRNNQQLKLRTHKRNVTAIILLSVLVFIALEAIFSLFSKEVLQKNVDIQDCVSTLPNNNVTFDNTIEAEAIQFRCTNVTGVNITHHFGNYSLQNSQIECSDHVAYSFTLGKFRNVTWIDGESTCAFRRCSYVFLRDDTLYVTGRVDGGRKRGQKLLVAPTNVVGLKLTKKDLPQLSKRLSELYEIPVLDEGEVRRRLLLGSVRGQCVFSMPGTQATRIPIGVVAAAVSVWSASLLLLVVSVLFSKSIFFDLSDPVHWARRARHDVTDTIGSEPMVQWSESLQRIRIVNYEQNRQAPGRIENIGHVTYEQNKQAPVPTAPGRIENLGAVGYMNEDRT